MEQDRRERQNGESGANRRSPGKSDIIIWAAVIIIGAALLLVFLLTRKPGAYVIVSVDGKETARYSLSDSVDTMIHGYNGGTNHLVILDGEACLAEADCPDRLCVKQGRISQVNDSIVCLPHRVSVHIVAADSDAPDAVVSYGEVIP